MHLSILQGRPSHIKIHSITYDTIHCNLGNRNLSAIILPV